MLRQSEVNTALMKPRLSKGVSAPVLGYIYAPTALASVLSAAFADWYYAGIPIAMGLLAHAILTWAFKKDHRVLEILGKYSLLADEYHPHARENLPAGLERPVGVGRGIRM